HMNMLLRQLSAMTGTGMTIAEAIKALAEDADDSPIRDLVAAMDRDLQGRKPAGEVIETHLPYIKGLPPAVFDRDLPAVSRLLSDIAEFGGKKQQLKRFSLLSFLYPGVVALLLFFVLNLLIILVVPMLASMYLDMGLALPLPTRMLIALSIFAQGWSSIILLLILALLAIVLWKKRYWLHALVDMLPILRELNRKIAGAQFARTLALLAKLNVPVQEMLRSAASSVTNLYYSRKIADIAGASRDFSQFIRQLREARLVPALVSHTVRAGERSATLAEALHESARFMEQDAEGSYNRIILLLYPVTMILLGLVVGFCIIAVYMPIFQIASLAG
ncbi:hypothetical protein D4S03_09460, partial [bacterium]